MDKVTCPVHIFTQPSPFLPHWRAHQVAMVTWRKVMCELNNMDFHSSSPTWLLTQHSAQSASKLLKPDMASFSRVPSSYLVAAFYIGHFLYGRSSCILTGTDTYSEYRFAFPTCNICAQTTMHSFANASLAIIVFYTA